MQDNLLRVMEDAKGNPVRQKKLETLGFLLYATTYDQDIAWRPFIGVTERTRKSVPRIVRAAFEGKRLNEVR